MVTIDGTDIVSGSTIDGDEISEITMDGDVVWSAIPDSGVLLDDWANSPTVTSSSITDRKNFSELDFQGDEPEDSQWGPVETRPDWNIADGSVAVSNNRLEEIEDEIVWASLPVDFSSGDTITVEYETGGNFSNRTYDSPLAESSSRADGRWGLSYSFTLYTDSDGDYSELRFYEDGGHEETIISGSDSLNSSNTLKYEFDHDGSVFNIEYWLNGESQGTGTSDSVSPESISYIGFAGREDSGSTETWRSNLRVY